jgi:hypothetical protein
MDNLIAPVGSVVTNTDRVPQSWQLRKQLLMRYELILLDHGDVIDVY